MAFFTLNFVTFEFCHYCRDGELQCPVSVWTLRPDMQGAAEGGAELEEPEEAALGGHRGRVIVEAVGPATAAEKSK